MHIALLNLTDKYRSVVTDEAVRHMASAYAHQLRYDVAPVWEITPPSVIFYPDENLVPPNAHRIAFMDDSDQQGVLGWHTEEVGANIYARVFAGPSIDNKGGVLTGDWSVAVTGSHEALEMALDPHCNLYASNGAGRLYSTELCDPVEGKSYLVRIGSRTSVSVSNFIYPAWANPNAAHDDLMDHLGQLSSPFQVAKAGYVVYEAEGKEVQAFGDLYPMWRKPHADDPMSRRVRKSRGLTATA